MSGTVTIVLDGELVSVRSDCSVAAALLERDERTLRHSLRRNEPRGLYCGMGVCFECILTIDGRAGERACLVGVRDGMRIDRS